MKPVLCLAALLAGACSADDPAPREEPSPAATPDAAQTAREAPARAYLYTSLDDCQELRRETEEMPFLEELCPGLGGYALKVAQSDLRENITVVAPGGRETSLDLSATGSGGFSELGPRVEWRGPGGGEFAPDSLIVRYEVAEGPEPGRDVSYLLPVRLAPVPCVVGKVPPGPDQNAAARAQADAPGACLAAGGI